ncbi:MAG: hypothetical protein U0Q15_14980 [Kineosporiaceae bacterium]
MTTSATGAPCESSALGECPAPGGSPAPEPVGTQPAPARGEGEPTVVPRWRRPGQLLVGLGLYALSMTLLLHADLGAMPWDVLQQGIARRTGLTFGTVTLLVGLVVLLGWVPLRQRPGIGTVANVVVISALVDPLLAVVPQPRELPLRAAMLLAGIGVNALATACYIGARLGPGPRDGLMTGIVARTGGSVRLVRTGIEVTVVTLGWLLGGTLGVGTVLYALGVGPLVQPLLRRLSLPERGSRGGTGGQRARSGQPSRGGAADG